MNIWEIVLALLLLAADQISKIYVSAHMSLLESITVIDGFFRITYTHNKGAAWGMLQGLGDVFAIVAIIISVLMIAYLWRNKTLLKWERFSVILIIAGALGNMIDRIRLKYVVDFMDFIIFGYDFPVFNIADSCLTVGVTILVIITLFVKKEDN